MGLIMDHVSGINEFTSFERCWMRINAFCQRKSHVMRCYVSIQPMSSGVWVYGFFIQPIVSHSHVDFTASKIENDKRISVLVSMWQTKIDIIIYQYVFSLRNQRGNTELAVHFSFVAFRTERNVEERKNDLILIWTRLSLLTTTKLRKQ